MPEVKVPRKSDLLLKEDPKNLAVLLEEVAENLNLLSVNCWSWNQIFPTNMGNNS